MDIQKTKALIAYLETYITDNKREKIDRVLTNRTKHVTIVLEDLFQQHNMSAVARTAEILGIQDIHIVESRNAYAINKSIARGSANWLDMHRYKDVVTCMKQLKEDGYRIVATTPHARANTLPDLSLDHKLAFIFGTELKGITQPVIDHADEFVMIPMYGFTESYNVSVSVGLCLYDALTRLHHSSIPWQLSESDYLEVRLRWLRKLLPYHHKLEQIFDARSR
jgi:tRNA (guanosine-2'-O-)-methyltransferase